MTDFDDDEKIVKLTEDFGFSGQARLLKIYRLIARQMDESDRCSVTYRAGFWTRQLGFRSATDCRSFLNRLATDQLLIADLSANDWAVTCRKLLEIRARKKPIVSKPYTLEVDVDVDREVDTPIVPKGPTPFDRFWASWPSGYKAGKKAAERAWKKAKLNGKIDEILVAIEKQKKSERWKGGYIPNPSTWINQGRWDDDLAEQQSDHERIRKQFVEGTE